MTQPHSVRAEGGWTTARPGVVGHADERCVRGIRWPSNPLRHRPPACVRRHSERCVSGRDCASLTAGSATRATAYAGQRRAPRTVAERGEVLRPLEEQHRDHAEHEDRGQQEHRLRHRRAEGVVHRGRQGAAEGGLARATAAGEAVGREPAVDQHGDRGRADDGPDLAVGVVDARTGARLVQRRLRLAVVVSGAHTNELPMPSRAIAPRTCHSGVSALITAASSTSESARTVSPAPARMRGCTRSVSATGARARARST